MNDWYCEHSENVRAILLYFGTYSFDAVHVFIVILICWVNKILYTAKIVSFYHTVLVNEPLQFVSQFDKKPLAIKSGAVITFHRHPGIG